MPIDGFVVPDGVEEAGLAAGGADEPEAAVGAGEDAGGFVDDDDVGGVADTGALVVGDGEDARTVGEFERVALAVGDGGEGDDSQ